MAVVVRTTLLSCNVGHGLPLRVGNQKNIEMKDKRTIIAERIFERGLTKKEVAERIGLHPSNLVSFLSGKRSIPFRKLELLEQMLGL